MSRVADERNTRCWAALLPDPPTRSLSDFLNGELSSSLGGGGHPPRAQSKVTGTTLKTNSTRIHLSWTLISFGETFGVPLPKRNMSENRNKHRILLRTVGHTTWPCTSFAKEPRTIKPGPRTKTNRNHRPLQGQETVTIHEKPKNRLIITP
jgi:hypothetical protein